MTVFEKFLLDLNLLTENKSLIKLSLGNYKGAETSLKNIYIKPVEIKQELMLSFVYRHQTKDITKNYSIEDAIGEIKELVGFKGFRQVNVQLIEENLVFQMNKKAEWRVQQEKVAEREGQSYSHDHQKERKLTSSSKPYLHQLNLTDSEGKVYKNAQDKWKQINHYIELLSSSLVNLPREKRLKVVDMGAGKGYLTFALYDYLKNNLQRDVEVVGVEFRKDLVDFCNRVAKDSGFEGLSFVEGTIEDYKSEGPIDVLIALHACDTATDDAIFKGIQNESSLIVVAPCCHKQVRRELEAVKAKNDLDFMIKYGIFLERHAEMLTDSIRSLIMEYYGYEMRVMQFISDQHTPKNVMLVGLKKSTDSKKQAEILNKIQELKQYFGIGYQHLERLCGLEK
ncbi:class I SAM-dependent methyltransferase [Sphingobacterium cellulitidis]|uniref:Methyltransferase n=1 Tax=Sphingobacterium cellulitidis TaxID=1768011 RepID=A0A8H9G118_9SPHI|nr:SAM-dependent methyltransferase [Sphingobacterium soli]MBA8986743.1 SAM-dependent methyltransferase [Sphingobacterium soli]GGE26864.1 methyltransferase [Sphingobacterium soli]